MNLGNRLNLIHYVRGLKRMALFIYWCLATMIIVAQEPDPATGSDLLEILFEENDDQFDLDTYLEILQNYQENPLNLNTATNEQLSSLLILSQSQMLAIIQYRERYGSFLSIYELMGVENLELDIILKIIPYLYVGTQPIPDQPDLKKIIKHGRHRLYLKYERTLEEKEGYVLDESTGERSYSGNPDKVYTRYRFSYRDRVNAGFTLEKDPGEALFRNNTGFDYYSAHLFIRGNGMVKSFAIGDYLLNFGQGLAMWTGFGFGKSPEVLNTRKTAHPLGKYSSVNENRFFRGAAATFKLKDFDLTVFGSSKKMDANISLADTLNEETLAVSSLQETGLHRTPAEIEDKKAIRQTVAGAHINYNGRKLNMGMTGIYTMLDANLEKDGSPYNHFRFGGNKLANASIDYNYLHKGILFFGETAISDNGSIATLNGLTANFGQTGISIVQRDYAPGYQQLFGSGFGEGSNTNNEKGIYIGLSTSINRNLKLQGYIDFFTRPWLGYTADAPSNGMEYLLQLDYKPAWHTSVYARFKQESKAENVPGNSTNMDYLCNKTKTGFRFHVARKISGAISVDSRIEWSRFDIEGRAPTFGMLIYQDIDYRFSRIPLSFKGRIALFDTDTWDNRIYAYESDVLYSFTVPAFNGKGTRFYFLASYKFNRHLQVWARVAQTFYPYQQSIGTGDESISGNRRTDIKLQIHWLL